MPFTPVLIFILLVFSFAFAEAERVKGANNSLETVQGAKSSAVGSAALPVKDDLPTLVQNPLQLSELERLSLAFTHVSYFEETTYNGVVMALPLRDAGAIGLAVSRFGAGDIPYIKERKENDPLPEGDSYNTLDISDWIFTSAWGKSFGKWNLAFSLHLLKRELDQSGWGFSSDIAMGYEFSKSFMLAGIIKGWTSSAVKWESGYFEYSSPEAMAAFRLREPFPYFYGNLNLYWQSAGILHSASEKDTRAWQNPVNWFLASNAGLEFETDFLFSLRAGLVEASDLNTLTLGAGIKPISRLSADYAFQMHSELSSVHRISITARF
ncbi:MAG: hypothetical protein LBB36_04455 [Fibromonadaceae bacterium]|nr:hypothetical protein [Fibromonadaceae bacterium]